MLPSRSGRMIDFGDIWEAFQVLAQEGGLGVIHAEDNDIVMHMYAKLIRDGRMGYEHLAEVHNQLSEDLSFRRILRLADSVPGTTLYMMHVSAGTGVAAIAEARRKGFPVYGETLHQYLLYSADDYRRPNGQIYHTYPSLKTKEDQKALWQGTANNTIHCIATDELCCTLKDKTVGSRIDDTTGGNSGVEPRLGVMYTEMVQRRGYPLSQYVDLVSSNAAKIMGLYPRKGAIAPKSEVALDLACELLLQSLAAWRVVGGVARSRDGAIMICGARKDIRIDPAPSDPMFRWMVTIDGRKRGATSIVGVLRQVRDTLD